MLGLNWEKADMRLCSSISAIYMTAFYNHDHLFLRAGSEGCMSSLEAVCVCVCHLRGLFIQD